MDKKHYGLPELRSGDILTTKSGRQVEVQVVRSHRATQDKPCDEPCYRLLHDLGNGKQLAGRSIWTLDDLIRAGCHR